MAPDAAAAVWRDLLRSSRYTFNKAHAAGYGLLAYQAAYLKVHHPVEFHCALLNHHAGMYGVATIAGEARRMGVTLLAPCVNRSDRRHWVEAPVEAPVAPARGPGEAAAGDPAACRRAGSKAIRLGLGLVKGLSAEAIGSIVEGRPFRSLGDLLRRTRIPRREVESLVLAGALDFTGLNRPQLLWELESTYERERGRGSLGLAAAGGEEWAEPRHPPLRDYEPAAKVRREIESLGLPLTAHPLAIFRERLAERGCLTVAAVMERAGGGRPGGEGRRKRETARVAGLSAAWRPAPTRKGETLGFLTLEDETGLLETTLFPAVYRRSCRLLVSAGPFIAEGEIEERRRAISLQVRKLEVFELPR